MQFIVGKVYRKMLIEFFILIDLIWHVATIYLKQNEFILMAVEGVGH